MSINVNIFFMEVMILMGVRYLEFGVEVNNLGFRIREYGRMRIWRLELENFDRDFQETNQLNLVS